MDIDDLKKEVDFDEFNYDTPVDDFVPPVSHYDDTFEKNKQGFGIAYGGNKMTSSPDRDDERVKSIENKALKVFAVIFGVVGVAVLIAYFIFLAS